MCNGAPGGASATFEGYHGGSAYGIINLETSKNVYAYVGGAGGDADLSTQPNGGFNGGGKGGAGGTGQMYGAGGGGASDLRLLRPEDVPYTPYYPTIPPEYQQLEYIESTGAQVIQTDAKIKGDTRLVMGYGFLPNADDGDAHGMFGAEDSAGTGGKSVAWYYMGVINYMYGDETFGNVPTFSTSTTGACDIVELDKGKFTINGIDMKNTSPSGNGSSQPFTMFGVTQAGSIDYRHSIGRLYWARVYMTTIDTEKYYYEGPDPQTAKLGYRHFQRQGTGPTWSFLYNGTGGWRGCVSIADNANDATWIGDGYSTGNSSFVASNGETYYISGNGNWMPDYQNDQYGHLNLFPEDHTFTDNHPWDHGNEILEIFTGGQDPSTTKYVTAQTIKTHEYVPVKRLADDVVGLYDTVTGNFFTDGTGSGIPFVIGQEGTFSIGEEQESVVRRDGSLNSRFIVAGGGGGASSATITAQNTSTNGFGGGEIGGPIISGVSGDNGKCASQNDGYSFGSGQDAGNQDPSANYAGPAGGGGGWFGGYSITPGSGSQYGGSGGSGYVCTSTSYKPSGYLVTSDFYMTDVFMTGMTSIVPSIIICDPITDLQNDDTIIILPTGEMCGITLPMGTYTMKCWGADGGIVDNINTQHSPGGYTQGTVEFIEDIKVYAVVGSTGICTQTNSTQSVINSARPDIAYNGGGVPSMFGNPSFYMGGYGGGASDIRMQSPEDAAGGSAIPDIPPEYQQVEYIESTGTQYIFPDYIPGIEDIITTKVVPIGGSYQWEWIFGTRSGLSGYYGSYQLVYVYNFNKGQCWYLRSANESLIGSIPLNQIVYIKTDKANIQIKDSSGNSYSYNDPYYQYATDPVSPLCIFACNANTSPTGKTIIESGAGPTVMKLYWLRAYNQSLQLLHEFVPCYRKSDDKTGLYDTVDGVFYPNDGTGEFTLGNEGSYSIPDTIIQDLNELSLKTRILVAGGSGGAGGVNPGGEGGGTTGGVATGSSGECSGPGTQNGSPQSQTYSYADGGFGYGGSGINAYGDTRDCGAGGGGGWYGGSGSVTYAQGEPGSMSAAGGSGYILTDESYKPTGYNVSDNIRFSNGVTTIGGNNLPYGQSKIEIHVDQLSTFRFLCRDSAGLKYYDEENETWTLLNEELSPETFETYGSINFVSDVGLNTEYDILLYDVDDNFDEIEMEIVPLSQTITCDTVSRVKINRVIVESEYDNSIYDLDVKVERMYEGASAHVLTTATISKNDVSDKVMKLYFVEAFDN